MGLVAAAESATAGANRDARDDPVPGAGAFDAQVDDRDVGVGEFREVGVDDTDVGVEDLADRERLAGTQVQAPQTDGARVEGDRLGFDGGDTQHRHENPTARGQFDGQTQCARLLPGQPDRDHHVADPADRFAVGTKDGQPD